MKNLFRMQTTFFGGAFLKSDAPTRWATQFVTNTRRVQNVVQQQQQQQQLRNPTAKNETKQKTELRTDHKNTEKKV